MPRALRVQLADTTNKWVVLINPPYGEATDGVNAGAIKGGIAATRVKKLVPGRVQNELFAQFLWRIQKELPQATLGTFASLKYVTSPAAEVFRSKWNFRASGGFVFPCKAFHGVHGEWPVSFVSWQPGAGGQPFNLDILDLAANNVGQKLVRSSGPWINTYADRPAARKEAVPFTNAITVCSGKIRLDRLSEGAIGFVTCLSADPQNSLKNALWSQPYSGGHGYSVDLTNLNRAMEALAITKSVAPNWINNRDQFGQPPQPVPKFRTLDCLIFNLFSGHNQTAAMADVRYANKTWIIHNHFFPFWDAVEHDEVTGNVPLTKITVPQRNPTPICTYLDSNKDTISAEAAAVLEAGKKVYQKFYKDLGNLPLGQWKINYPRPGWYQIRNALGACDEISAVKSAVKALKEKIANWVYADGILVKEVWFGDDGT